VRELSGADLDELVEEAIVDAYGEDEQLAGFYTMIEENLALPFTTRVLGVEVTVEGIDLTDWGVAAICVRGAHRQPIAILDLPLPVPPPPGSEWITAYGHWAGRPAMSEYQYYEFLAVDRPLTATEQAEVRRLSTRARITATSFTNEYHWGDFRGSPEEMMQRYYDAHLYLANWGTHRVMLRLPRTLLDPKVTEQYCVDGQVSVSTTGDYVILDLASEDEAGEWVEDAEDSLSAIVGVRSELAAGDLRPLYLAWLSGYGVWERDEDAFGDEDEDEDEDEEEEEVEVEPPVPAGLGSLTAAQRALADFLRLDSGLLEVAAEASPGLPEVKDDARALATHIARLPVSDKDGLLTLVAEDRAARARMELLRGFRGDPDDQRDSRPRRTVAGLLDTAGARRLQREQRVAAVAAAQQALRERQRAAARQRRLDELAQDPETAWADVERQIGTRLPAQYDSAVALLRDLQEIAQREDQAQAFARRSMALREAHLRKPSLIARFDRAGLTL